MYPKPRRGSYEPLLIVILLAVIAFLIVASNMGAPLEASIKTASSTTPEDLYNRDKDIIVINVQNDYFLPRNYNLKLRMCLEKKDGNWGDMRACYRMMDFPIADFSEDEMSRGPVLEGSRQCVDTEGCWSTSASCIGTESIGPYKSRKIYLSPAARQYSEEQEPVRLAVFFLDESSEQSPPGCYNLEESTLKDAIIIPIQ